MIDLTAYLNPWDEFAEERLFRQLHNNLYFVGSRAILQHPDINENTDYDFMEKNTPEFVEWLNKIGFEQKVIDHKYMDKATASVWQHPIVNVQVVLKKPEHFEACREMWSVFRDNPLLFREYFWKSNPDKDIDQDVVRERIERFLDVFSVK